MFLLLIDLRLPVLIALVVKGGYSSLFGAALQGASGFVPS